VNPWQGINRFLLAYREALVAMTRRRTWSPFFTLFLVQIVLAVWLYLSVRPPFVDFLRAWPESVIPPQFFGYPLHMLLLPSVLYGRILVPFGALLESAMLAAATLVFIQFAQRQALPGLGAALRGIRFGYWQFVAFWVLNFALILGLRALFEMTVGDLWIGFARRRMALEAAQIGLSVVVNGLIAYSTVIIVTERTTFLQTLGRAVEFFGRHWFSTLCIVGFGTLILLPSNLLMQRAHEWIGRFNPEVMMAVLGFSMISAMLAYYLMASVLCFWYLMHRSS